MIGADHIYMGQRVQDRVVMGPWGLSSELAPLFSKPIIFMGPTLIAASLQPIPTLVYLHLSRYCLTGAPYATIWDISPGPCIHFWGLPAGGTFSSPVRLFGLAMTAARADSAAT